VTGDPPKDVDDRQTLVDRPRLAGRHVVGVVLFAALVLAGLSAWSDVDALAADLSRYRWGWFVWALVLAVGNFVLRYVRWEVYLRRLGIRVPGVESAAIFLSGFVASITPGKLGEVYKSFLLYERHGVSVMRTAPIVVAERLTDLVALVMLTAYGALALPGGIWFAVGGAAISGGLMLVTAVRPLGELFLRIARGLPGIRRLEPRLREAYESLWRLNRPGPLAAATVLGVVAWALEVGSLHAVLAGFVPSETMPAPETSFAYAAPTIAGAVALLPGGLGVTEASMTAILRQLSPGMALATATAATILVRLATLWWATLVGALALVVLRMNRRPAPAASAAS